ncbi:MAG: magnesium/cobalt transporter CorA [bacterium]
MRRPFFARSKKAGLAPGSLVYTGEKRKQEPKITIFDYSASKVEEKVCSSIEETFKYRDTTSVTWINIDGIHKIDIIEKIGKHFNLHPLILEDILNTNQRPKVEDLEEFLFIILRMHVNNAPAAGFNTEQVSLLLTKNCVISFQEQEGDLFDPIRERIRTGKGRIRSMGTDYLAYTLIDAVVDNFFFVLEQTGELTENLENEVIENPEPEVLHRLHSLKQNLLFLRKSVWPLREEITKLKRTESSLITPSTNIYLNDVYDHTIQIIDMVETMRDIITGLQDMYLSNISNKMNEVMKVLTIIATIFIPLTFIAGIYGMNFTYMPELQYKWGYFIILGVMGLIMIGMIWFFRRRKWL